VYRFNDRVKEGEVFCRIVGISDNLDNHTKYIF
jgi:hypothetical protein